MKLLEVAFVLVAFSILRVLLISGIGNTEIDFPSLEVPEFEFIDVSGGCASFTDCTEYLANIIKNIGEATIKSVQLTFNLTSFIFQVFLLLTTTLLTPIKGAPWVVNVLMTFTYTAALGFIVYRAIRSGDTSA